MSLSLMDQDKEIVLCWVPGHVNIKGNETADFFANKALMQEIHEYTVPYTDLQQTINSFIMYNWQTQWNSC